MIDNSGVNHLIKSEEAPVNEDKALQPQLLASQGSISQNRVGVKGH